MKAAVHLNYGSLVVRDLETPEPGEGELLVRVRSTSLNAVDWYGFRGRPYLARPLMGVLKPRDSEAGSDSHSTGTIGPDKATKTRNGTTNVGAICNPSGLIISAGFTACSGLRASW